MAVVRDWAKKEMRRAASDPGGKNSALRPCVFEESELPFLLLSQSLGSSTHLVVLRDEEHGRAKGALAVLLRGNLVVE